MIVVMGSRDKTYIEQVTAKVLEYGMQPHVIEGVERTVVAVVGDERGEEGLAEALESLPYVEKVLQVLKPYKLAAREVKKEDTIVEVGSAKIGGPHFCVIAGPCSVESREQILETAHLVKEAGAHMLRGGAFKPRTSPYSFQGMAKEGLELLREAGDRYGLPVVTEVMAPEQVSLVEEYADMLQVGARNMQNFALLRAVGRASKPVFLKRGMMCTINEFLMSAEYILAEGNTQVVLCERGIRTFETETRNTLDIQAVPVIQKYSHLPIVIDPSHASGHWDLVIPMARAAVAAGANGLMVEVHPHPERAVSDGPQSLKPSKFVRLMEEIRPLVAAMGKTL
jgi:3-deoxy-7-phosphoheptulonate synthase